jgi:hypothetical protein
VFQNPCKLQEKAGLNIVMRYAERIPFMPVAAHQATVPCASSCPEDDSQAVKDVTVMPLFSGPAG